VSDARFESSRHKNIKAASVYKSAEKKNAWHMLENSSSSMPLPRNIFEEQKHETALWFIRRGTEVTALPVYFTTDNRSMCLQQWLIQLQL
jgi:hypothetical protein